MTITILSTAQHGAERGALQAAIDLGLTIGGWRCAGDDVPPIFATTMRQTSSVDRGMARRLCVQDSDGTLALSGSIAPVGVVAFLDRVTEQQGKPFMSVVLGDKLPEAVRGSVLDWMRDNSIARLYVAGPAEDDEPGVEARARAAVKFLLEPLALDQLGKFVDIVKLLEGAVDSDQPRIGMSPDPVEDRARSYHALVATAPGPIGVAEPDDPLDEFLESLECCPRPPTEADIDRLTEEFYKLDGNGAGGSLHVVLDDGNWERDCVEFCRKWAVDRNDIAGERFADLLLTLTDEQLRAWLGAGYCGTCGADPGDPHSHGALFKTPGGRCPRCGSEPAQQPQTEGDPPA